MTTRARLRAPLSQPENWSDARRPGQRAWPGETARQPASRKRDLKYTRVPTILRRREQKGNWGQEKRGRACVYRAVEPARSLAPRAVRQIVDSFLKGSVEERVSGVVDAKVLTKGALEILEAYVRERRKGGK